MLDTRFISLGTPCDFNGLDPNKVAHSEKDAKKHNKQKNSFISANMQPNMIPTSGYEIFILIW